MRSLLALLLLLCACPAPENELTLGSGGILLEDEDLSPDPLLRPVAGAPASAEVIEGMVEPLRFHGVSFDVPGTVQDVFVKRGEAVKKGQVLATLERADREARLAEFEQLLREARRALPASRRSNGDQPPEYLIREMEQRLAEVMEQVKHLEGDRRAFQRKLELQGQEAARDFVAEIARRRNTKPRTQAMRRANHERLSIALVDDLESRVRQLKFALEQSTLKSPIDGVLVAVTVFPGEPWATRALDEAFEILDPDGLVVRAEVRRQRADTMTMGELSWVELGVRGKPVVEAGVQEVSRDTRSHPNLETGGQQEFKLVTFKLPGNLPPGVDIGTDVRIALQN